jgi:hypothetical protein
VWWSFDAAFAVGILAARLMVVRGHLLILRGLSQSILKLPNVNATFEELAQAMMTVSGTAVKNNSCRYEPRPRSLWLILIDLIWHMRNQGSAHHTQA